MSRPMLKTPELIQGIIDLITSGHNMSSICDKKGMPGRATVYRWMMDDPEFYKAYKKAVSLRAHESFLDVFEIADRPKATFQDVAADRLRCSVRLRAASIANPALNRMRRKKKKDEFKLPDELEFVVVRPDENYERSSNLNEDSFSQPMGVIKNEE